MRAGSIKIHSIKEQRKMVSITNTNQNMTQFMKQTKRNQETYNGDNIRNCNSLQIPTYCSASFFIHNSNKTSLLFKVNEPTMNTNKNSTDVPLIEQNPIRGINYTTSKEFFKIYFGLKAIGFTL